MFKAIALLFTLSTAHALSLRCPSSRLFMGAAMVNLEQFLTVTESRILTNYQAMFQEAPASATAAPTLLKRDRYVATNRFTVRSGKDAKFEQRWATRKSRLATLEGFKYFQLMRRVKVHNSP